MHSKNIILIILSCVFFTISGCKKKEDEIVAVLETGIVSDNDGRTYKTIKIGNQWWMAEDLRTTKYRDSSFISLIAPTDTTWSTLTSGAYSKNMDNNGNIIGIFYNHYAITDPRGIAPIGWHIPTDEEWKQMEKYLGMSVGEANNIGWRGTHEGEKLKVVKGTVNGWSDYGSVWTTNESGFSALAGGCRMFDGSQGDPGQYYTGFWWTLSTTENNAWYRHLDYKNANVFRYNGPRTYGYSVRCVKD